MYETLCVTLAFHDDNKRSARRENLHIPDTCRRYGNTTSACCYLNTGISSAQMSQRVCLDNSLNIQATDKLKTPL